MRDFTPQAKQTILTIAVVLLLGAIFFSPVVFRNQTFYAFDTLLGYLPWSGLMPDHTVHNTLITDPVNVFYPGAFFFKKCMESGKLCFWDPSLLCGMPFDPLQNPVAFFLRWLLPLTTAHDVLLWLHLTGAGVFTLLYLRKIGLHPLPALIGGAAWMFNGYVMVWLEFENVPMMAPTLPAMLLFIECWLSRRNRLFFFLFVGSIAYAVSVRYEHMLIYQMLFIGVYLVFRLGQSVREGMDFGRITIKRLVVALAGLCIVCAVSSGILYRSFATLNQEQQRRSYGFNELYRKTGQVPVRYLTTLLYPDLFGNPARQISFTPKIRGAQPYNNYNELCLYAGIVPLFLAAAAVLHWKSGRFVLFYLFGAGVTLTMAMGSVLYFPLARFVPGLDLSTPTRILYLFGFALCVLAAMGADLLYRNESIRKKQTLAVWLALGAFALAVGVALQTEAGMAFAGQSIFWAGWERMQPFLREYYGFSSPVVWEPLALTVVTLVAVTAALVSREKRSRTLFLCISLVILAFDLISFGRLYNTVSPKWLEYPETPAVAFLKRQPRPFRILTMGRFLHNGFSPFGIQDMGGYASFYPKRYGEYLHLSQHGTKRPFPDQFSRWVVVGRFGSPLLDLLNARYILLPPGTPVRTPQLNPVYSGEIDIYENRTAFPRVFFVPSHEVIPARRDLREALASYSREDFARKVILEKAPPVPVSPKERKSRTSGPDPGGRLVFYGNDRIELVISTPRSGFLVLSDSYHPGWRAEVDGKSAEVLRANFIMRAVPLGPGRHRVVLTFSTPLKWTATAAAAGWLMLAPAMGIAARRWISRGWRGA